MLLDIGILFLTTLLFLCLPWYEWNQHFTEQISVIFFIQKIKLNLYDGVASA
jgi:hypothetical protein